LQDTSEVDHGHLLRACAAGDRKALKALDEAEAPRMRGVARRMLRRNDLADEALQDAFVRIWQKASLYDPNRGSALGWIYTIQRHTALNILRAENRDETTAPEDIDAMQDSRQASFETADDIWERLSTSGRLRLCLERLEPVRRQAVLLS
jgi:RNA polymerase sigma-70 factor (ECF subfamily)